MRQRKRLPIVWYIRRSPTSNTTLDATLVQCRFWSVDPRVSRTDSKILNDFYDDQIRDVTSDVGKQRRSPTSNFFFGLTLVQRQFMVGGSSKKNSKILNEFYDVNPTLIRRWYNVAFRHQTNVGLTLLQRQFWSVDPQKKIQKFSMSSTT